MLLYLVRHPRTQPDPALPASQWRLSAQGHAQVRALVDAPFWERVTAVWCSADYKTTVVGEAVRAAHGLPFWPTAALGEARRESWTEPEAFAAAQRAFFAHPAVPPLPDWESAQAAQARFVAALDHLLAAHPAGEALAVISHATVLTLYVAHLCGEIPTCEMWSAIGFAAVMAVERAGLRPLTPFLPAPYADLPG